jgi:hypothetical protein
MPRKDLHVSLGDVTVNVALALGSWTAFLRTGDGAMVMGDLVLTEDEDGMTVPPALGVATAINFQPTGDGKAAITGDFVLLGKEANPVMKALRDNGIQVTALHSHMLTEEPRLFFMHFWANDDAAKLARGLRVALDQTNSKK